MRLKPFSPKWNPRMHMSELLFLCQSLLQEEASKYAGGVDDRLHCPTVHICSIFKGEDIVESCVYR
jgi:hypothetical protein